MTYRLIPLLLSAVLALAAPLAQAQPVPDNLLKAEILPGWRTESGSQMAALRLTMAPGWKTYWRAPGDAGIPPRFDWTGSANLKSVTYHWPKPQIFDLNGLRTLAYPDSLVLPIEFIPAKTGAPVSVTLKADIGVCEEICVPASFSLTADLPTPGQPDPVIRAALASGPTDGHSLGLARPRCTVEPIRDGLRLHADIALPDAAKGDFAVIETADPGIWISPVEVQAGNGHLVQTSDMVPPAAKPFMLDRSSLRMTLFTARGDVIELTGCSG